MSVPHRHNTIPWHGGARHRGTILILVLIVLSSLVALSVGLAHRTRIELRLAQTAADRVRAFYLARGGIERIRILLAQPNLPPQAVAALCGFSETADHEQLLAKVSPPTASPACLAYSLRDELGCLHISKSNPASWERVAGITREDVAAILDWSDADDQPGPGGAEAEFYERLTPPYTGKNRPFATLRELLFVRGIDSGRYLGARITGWGPVSPEGEQHVPVSISAPDSGEAGDLGLVDVFTVYGDGKLNLNTASPSLLAAIQGLDEQSIGPLLTHRAGEDHSLGTEDDGFVSSADQLSEVPGLSELQIEVLKESCCFKSEYFRAFALAKAGSGGECCLMASMQTSGGKVSLLSVERLF